MGKTEKITLTPQQERWLIRHFKHTKNDEIMSRLGLSHSTLHRLARELGLKKSKQFMKKCQEATTQAAWRANRRKGWPPKGYRIPNRDKNCFKKGVTNLQRLGPKRNAERIAKSAATRRETVRKEHARIVFGLPQKTKLKIFSNPNRIQIRYQLKKRGYLVERGGREAIVTPHTQRSPRYEEKARREGMKIIEQAV